jgi:hypothetical protein
MGEKDAARPIATVIETLVRAGIAVESAGLHPHWTVQLLEQMV